MTLEDGSVERLRRALKSDSALTGQVVNERFELLDRAARGGAADLYRAFDRQLNRFVAVKFLRGVSESDILRFAEEVEKQAGLNHPNIVAVYERGTAFGMAYVAMPWVEGSSLDGRKLSIDEAVSFLEPIAEAVDFAHRKGILHGDIKPANILVSSDGHVYLTDFGLARHGNGRIFGTPEYMSPEQTLGAIDARSDLYALGATLFALLSGAAPFHGRSTEEVLHQIRESAPPALPGLPVAVGAVLRKAMARSPTDRYPTGAAFGEELRRLGLDESIVALRRPLVSKVVRRARRNRMMVISLIGCAVAGLLAMKYFLESREERRRNESEHRLAESYRLLHEQAPIEQIIPVLDEAIRAYPLLDAHALRGHLYMRQGRACEALGDFAEAAQAPELRQGRYDVALQRLQGSDDVSSLLRAICARKLGRPADFESYLKRHPDERAGIEQLLR